MYNHEQTQRRGISHVPAILASSVHIRVCAELCITHPRRAGLVKQHGFLVKYNDTAHHLLVSKCIKLEGGIPWRLCGREYPTVQQCRLRCVRRISKQQIQGKIDRDKVESKEKKTKNAHQCKDGDIPASEAERCHCIALDINACNEGRVSVPIASALCLLASTACKKNTRSICMLNYRENAHNAKHSSNNIAAE